jgi:hypothetical protein
VTKDKKILEENFPIDYRGDVAGQMCSYIIRKESFTLIGVKDNCKVNMLRFLAMRTDVQEKYLGEKAKEYLWVVVNLDELCEFTLTGFYHLLGSSLVETVGGGEKWKYLNNLFIDSPTILLKALKEDLAAIAEKTGKTIVILLNNFDIAKKLDLDLVYHQLVAIRQVVRFDICYVFSGTRPYEPQHFFFNKTVWMTPFKETDAKEVIERNEKRYGIKLSENDRKKVLELSGGHAGMIKFLIQNVEAGKPLGRSEDTDFQCERILSTLTDLERAKLKNNQKDELLVNLGLQEMFGDKAKCFSELLANFLKRDNRDVPVFCWDRENDEVYFLGKPLKYELANKEFVLLKLLLSKPGRTFSREEIMNQVWGEEHFPSDWALDKQISRLREKIGQENLKVIRGQGVMIGG